MNIKLLKNLFILAVVGLVSAVAVTAQTPLTSLSGVTVDIQGQKGKVVIVAIGATWLPLSGKQAEFTNSLARKYAGKNVSVYFVATDSVNAKSKNYASDEKIRQWAAEKRLTVTVLRDPDGAAVMRKFAVDQLPAFIVLDKNGSQSGDAFGGIDPNYDITVPISKRVDPLL